MCQTRTDHVHPPAVSEEPARLRERDVRGIGAKVDFDVGRRGEAELAGPPGLLHPRVAARLGFAVDPKHLRIYVDDPELGDGVRRVQGGLELPVVLQRAFRDLDDQEDILRKRSGRLVIVGAA